MKSEYIKEGSEVIVLKKQDLTKPIGYVNPMDKIKYWDRDYINEKIAEVTNLKHKMLLQFMWMTGCRVSEAINVQKQHLDLKNHIVTIRWLKNRKYSYRNIPLHPKLRDVLEIFTAPMLAETIIFKMSRQRAWMIVKKNMDGHPHQLRHSFAVNWLKCEGDIVILSKVLGHSNINITMEYLQIVPADQGKEMLKVKFDSFGGEE